jgi:hypothetical protein
MRTLLLVSTFATLFTVSALACGGPEPVIVQTPDPVAQIDQMLPNATLSPADLDQVKALRSQAKALVDAKRHDEAQRIVEKAERVMGYVRPNCSPFMFQNRQAPTG